MPAYAPRADKWLGRKLTDVKQTAAANTAGSTDYTIEYPARKAGDERPEHERGVSVGIIGNNLAFDHQGNPTGLTGSGAASKKTGSWVKL